MQKDSIPPKFSWSPICTYNKDELVNVCYLHDLRGNIYAFMTFLWLNWVAFIVSYNIYSSAGVGRTGTYIALDILTEQGKALGYVDVCGCVAALRRQRVNMVQTLVFLLGIIILHDTVYVLFRKKCGVLFLIL